MLGTRALGASRSESRRSQFIPSRTSSAPSLHLTLSLSLHQILALRQHYDAPKPAIPLTLDVWSLPRYTRPTKGLKGLSSFPFLPLHLLSPSCAVLCASYPSMRQNFHKSPTMALTIDSRVSLAASSVYSDSCAVYSDSSESCQSDHESIPITPMHPLLPTVGFSKDGSGFPQFIEPALLYQPDIVCYAYLYVSLRC